MPCPTGNEYPMLRVLCPVAARCCRAGRPSRCAVRVPPRAWRHRPPTSCSKPFELHHQLPLEDGSQALVMTDALFNLGDKPPTGLGTLLRLWAASDL